MIIKDFELIKQAQKGNMQAFEELLDKYDRMVMNIALSFRNNEDDAKDIYQEVFIRVYKGLNNFKFNSEFSTWIYRITTNVCITFHKRMKRHSHDSLDREIIGSADDYTKVGDLINGGLNSESTAIGSDLAEHIETALAKLSARQKLVFTLKYYDGYKIREIAEMMKCAEGTVKRYLFTATNKMRDNLKDLI